MRLLIALAFVASVAASTAASAGMWAPPFFSADEIQNGVACKVKKITVLAKNAGDCARIGGRLLKPAS